MAIFFDIGVWLNDKQPTRRFIIEFSSSLSKRALFKLKQPIVAPYYEQQLQIAQAAQSRSQDNV